MHQYHLTRISGNSKTGPIPVSTTSANSCPAACPLKNNGCYAEQGPLALHWRAVSENRRGGSLDEFCAEVQRLPKHQLWRYGQAGDLPGDGQQINTDELQRLADANAGKRGFGYTHYSPLDPVNARAIAKANAQGFTINLSANSLEHADELARLKVGPVVTLLPPDQLKPTTTPEGRHVSICPASVRDDVSCATCGVCAIVSRRTIIGFPAHGTGTAKAAKVFFMAKASCGPRHSDDTVGARVERKIGERVTAQPCAGGAAPCAAGMPKDLNPSVCRASVTSTSFATGA